MSSPYYTPPAFRLFEPCPSVTGGVRRLVAFDGPSGLPSLAVTLGLFLNDEPCLVRTEQGHDGTSAKISAVHLAIEANLFQVSLPDEGMILIDSAAKEQWQRSHCVVDGQEVESFAYFVDRAEIGYFFTEDSTVTYARFTTASTLVVTSDISDSYQLSPLTPHSLEELNADLP